MKNLRINTVSITDSKTIVATFTENIVKNISTGNIKIYSQTNGVMDSSPVAVRVLNNSLTITCQPLIPYAAYTLTFQSTELVPFKSLNGDAILLEDGVGNAQLILGPALPDNPIRNFINNYLQDNIYNISDPTTLVSKAIQGIADVSAKSLYDVRQIKNENYLSIEIPQEEKVRGAGPYDRLDEEGAYEVSRVALLPPGTITNNTLKYFPYSLQISSTSESIISGISNIDGAFNIDTLVINTSNYPVTKVSSIVFSFDNGKPDFVYDLETLNYYLKDASYDPLVALTDYSLEINQIKLSTSILNNIDFYINNISSAQIRYEFSGTNTSSKYYTGGFPFYPVTLQKMESSQTLQVDSLDEPGKFNINGLIINTYNYPVTRLNSVKFIFATSTLTYDIARYGYQIVDNRYDPDLGSTYKALQDNQFKLNLKIKDNPLFEINDLLSVEVKYEYKDLGRIILADSLRIDRLDTSTRESLPPIINIFNLKHAPIVNANNEVYKTGGVTFTSPDLLTSNQPHPSFLTEIPFNLNSVPSFPGQYSIDYTTGRVYVFGADNTNSGTGATPPLATYQYRYSYQSEIDYVYDNTTRDLVSLPNGSLRDNAAYISFDYEEVLVPGVDYTAEVHKEALQERVNNNLLNLGTIRTSNYPVTNVFRIYNETSGETYSLQRFNNDKIYYNYVTPPQLGSITNEKVSFELVNNEMMFVTEDLFNASSVRIFAIYLDNNNIISASQDSIGSFTNSSAIFSDKEIFAYERYFDPAESIEINYDRLTTIGHYSVDYANGVVYVAVSSTQNYTVGNVSYKKDNIVTNSKHIISVDDIYRQKDPFSPKTKTYTYLGFTDNTIQPDGLINCVEEFYGNDTGKPYQAYNNQVGYFDQFSFVNQVTNEISYLQGIFEYHDMINSTNPINFAYYSSFSDNTITLGPVTGSLYSVVNSDGSNLYVNLPLNIPYISSDINFDISIIRSNGDQLWDTSGIIVPGNPVKLVLSGLNSPAVNDQVTLSYSISIKQDARVLVDYSQGDLQVDYTYLQDEIIVSYEYGDNLINFQKSGITEGTTYYVTYKVGALRDALLKNFGGLSTIEELNTFNINLDRERYRDALLGVLSSSLQGPTNPSLKNLVQKITHINPEIIESIFQNWSLGSSLLYPQEIETTGQFSLQPCKYGSGPLVNEVGQSISLPASSNISINEGTFETWVSPEWDGIDSQASITFSIKKNGNPVSPNFIFIGEREDHPTYVNGKFTVKKEYATLNKSDQGKDGVYIYCTNTEDYVVGKWNMDIIDANPLAENYSIEIITNGSFYGLDYNSGLPYLTITSSNKKVNITTDATIAGPIVDTSFTFIADYDHYLLDVGNEDKSRLSIYKDPGGYLNFKVIDKFKNSYSISSDISNWLKNNSHHVAASWRLNTDNNQDEMHLFVDGLEVPNIVKYGQKIPLISNEKFRTIDPEIKIITSGKTIVSGNDMSFIAGSNEVTSTLNFSYLGINVGDTFCVNDPLFPPGSCYGILGVNNNKLVIDVISPVTAQNVKFTVNASQFQLDTDAYVYPNIAVSTASSYLHGNDLQISLNFPFLTSTTTDFSNVNVGDIVRTTSDNQLYTVVAVLGPNSLYVNRGAAQTSSNEDFYIYNSQETELPGVRAVNPSYAITADGYYNSILTLLNNVKSNDIVFIRSLGLNYRRVKQNYYVWGDSEYVVETRLPPPISLNEVKVIKYILPATNANSSPVTYSQPIQQPSDQITGRTLAVTIGGTNVDFSSPVTVIIDGYNSLGYVQETLTFSDYVTQDTLNKFISINYCQVTSVPIDPSKDYLYVNVKEKYSLTIPEDTNDYPIIRYSYQMNFGTNLSGSWNYISQYDGYEFTDGYNSFSDLDINNIIYIRDIPAIGYYVIKYISPDRHTIIASILNASGIVFAPFAGAAYQVLNITDSRTGLQNGYFTFEHSLFPGTPYALPSGNYEFDYLSYLSVKLDPYANQKCIIGNDISLNKPFAGVIDETKIYSIMLTDTRVGEEIPATQRSVTKDYNSLVPLRTDKNTLALIHYDSYPFVNSADYYKKYIGGNVFQSNYSINDNFDYSIAITKNPIVLDNEGILNTSSEATVEFWANPLYDTENDPEVRYYFDAYGAKVVNVTSINNSTIMLNEDAESIISVTLQSGGSKDYFAGGKLELSNTGAILESLLPDTTSTVKVSNPIFQVISVTLEGDLTGTNYFNNGVIGDDNLTIYLTKPLANTSTPVNVVYKTVSKGINLNSQVIRLNSPLPKDNCAVTVKFIPKGFKGDRISLFKDQYGRLNFNIIASEQTYSVATPIYWSRNTWHRVKFSYKVNGKNNSDEMRLFVDGYERTSLKIEDNLTFSPYFVVGAMMTKPGITNAKITFKDTINQIYIGSDYSLANKAYCLMDNLRISNISRPIYQPYGEALDPNYSSNLNTVYPVTEDLYTTYLLNMDHQIVKNTDFAFLLASEGSNFDFTMNVFDSFGIVNSSDAVKQILEKSIKMLKPANTRVYINYSS